MLQLCTCMHDVQIYALDSTTQIPQDKDLPHYLLKNITGLVFICLYDSEIDRSAPVFSDINGLVHAKAPSCTVLIGCGTYP